MGLGVALTGFLTGFAKRATVEIDTRNKELRKTISDRLAKYQDTVGKEYEDKIEERKLAKKRASLLKNISGLELSIPQQAALVTSEASFNSFIKATEGKSPLQIKELSTKLKFGDSIKGNLDPKKPMTLNQAIDLRTEFRPTTPLPGVTDTRTAFGMNSDIQQKALDNFAAENPELIPSGTQIPLNSDTVQFLKPNSKEKLTFTQNVETFADNVASKLSKNITGRKLGKYEVGNFLTIEVKEPKANDALKFRKIEMVTGINNPVAKKFLEVQAIGATIATINELQVGESGVINYSEMLAVNKALVANGMDNINLEKLKKDGAKYTKKSVIKELNRMASTPFIINNESVSFEKGFTNIEALNEKYKAVRTKQDIKSGSGGNQTGTSVNNAKDITANNNKVQAAKARATALAKQPPAVQKIVATAQNFVSKNPNLNPKEQASEFAKLNLLNPNTKKPLTYYEAIDLIEKYGK